MRLRAIVCVAVCPEVPHTVREMDYMSRVKDGKTLLQLHIQYGHENEGQVKRLVSKTRPSGQKKIQVEKTGYFISSNTNGNSFSH